MKKRSLAMLLTVFSVFATVSCQAVEGPVGPKGDTGEVGPAGPKGDTGAKGEQGDTGLTAFGCTIVSSENGFVTVDKGSAVVGSDVTFTITPTNDATVLGLKLNDTTVYKDDLTKNENGSYSYTTKMVENGFVVVGLFVGDDTKANIVVEGYDKDNVPTGYEGEVIKLPLATVTDKYGIDLSSYLTITDVTKGVNEENTTIANGNFISDLVGVHTLKYVVTNPNTNEVINEKTININVVMKIVKDCTAPNDLTIENEATNPTMSIANKGIFGLSFNFEASKTYYAEVVVSKLTQNVANQIITISNNVTENGIPTGGMYYEGIKMNGGTGFEFATSKYLIGNSAWSDFGGDARCWHDQSIVNGRSGMDINPNTKAIKMAVARNNDTFYYFMDDKLLSIAKYPELKELDTYPGMAFYGGDHTGIKATMSDFKFIKDAKGVESKINELNTATFNYFSYWGNSKTNNFATFNGNSFTWKKEGSTTNDNMNANIVTPLVNLFGNWEVSYDVKANKIGDDDTWGKLLVDVRTLQDKKCVTTMHTTIGGSKTYYEALMNSCEVGSQTGTNFQSEFAKAFGGAISRDTELHFNIKCEVNDKVETYTITITDKNDENKTYTFTETVTYTGNYEYLAGGPKFLLFKSQKYSGTISNFEFK